MKVAFHRSIPRLILIRNVEKIYPGHAHQQKECAKHEHENPDLPPSHAIQDAPVSKLVKAEAPQELRVQTEGLGG